MENNILPMLTNNDVTVSNAPEIFEECKDLPVKFWGFKDVGLSEDKMKKLVKSMKKSGKTTFLEIVSLSEEDCMRGAKLAVECGFDYLIGTIFFDSVFNFLSNNKIKYFPFCGKIVGHPSVLEGSVDAILNDALSLQSKGVQGIDLLSYRHKTAAEEISKKLVDTLSIPVIIAGSINSFQRINKVIEIKPWAFTIGSALFNNKFGGEPGFKEQLTKVLNHIQI